MVEAEMRGEGPPDREEFHKLLIAHTTKAALIYIYISRADGTPRCRDSRALFFLLAFLRERIRARARIFPRRRSPSRGFPPELSVPPVLRPWDRRRDARGPN